MITLPLGLRHALETGNCVLFLGAGIGRHLKNSEGVPTPTAQELAGELADKFSIDTNNSDLAKIAAIVEIRYGRKELETFLQQRLN